jgi:uncharacterized protein (TIGR03067 family)
MVRRVSFLIILAVASTGLCADPKPAKDPLRGAWQPTSAVMAGEKMSDDAMKGGLLMFGNGKFRLNVGDQKYEGTYTVDKSKTPAQISLVSTGGASEGKTMLAIFEMDNATTLKVCCDMGGKAFPSGFESKADDKLFLATYKRVKMNRPLQPTRPRVSPTTKD